ncbi:alkaline phosphatase [Alkalihalobacterium elongatum]|uniref:alkaline phosphatase n=1 Tax=Alkalihalobacterium elongatum TaxID=2675466 RepID=UPI001C1FD04E|nr:alkaline phosphatase [Alkalihalobacterium elongatum]
MNLIKNTTVTLCLAVVITVFLLTYSVEATSRNNYEAVVDNVIFMIPDGFSASYATTYRIYKESEDLIFDPMLVGMVKTNSANNWVTDSAAAATALATGYKTNNKMVSISPEGKPLETILEAAKIAGKATGLVATATVTHATPAAFAAHVTSRDSQTEVALQMIDKVDVILGGGKRNFLPKSVGGLQQERNLIEELELKGYTYIENREDLLKLDAATNKLLGLFAEGPMSPELDRNVKEEPSLANMTATAISTLSQNKDGFFLMVEGSQIDWAGHAQDAAWAMKDVEAFEKAVEVALDFARNDGRTLLVIVGDHDTGGMSVGGCDSYLSKAEILREVKATGKFMANKLSAKRRNAKEILKTYANIDLTKAQVKRIKKAKDDEVADVINNIISEHAFVGWTTKVHSGVDVPIYAFGPTSERFTGLIDNTDIPKRMAHAMGIHFKDVIGSH